MIGSHIGRIGTATLVALSITLGACGGDAADTDTTAMMDTTTAMGAGAGMTAGAPAWTNEQIMSQVSAANGIEIATSELAREKATAEPVRAFAVDMVNEHQRLQGEADQLATTLNVVPQPPVPDTLTERLNTVRTQLQNEAAGAGFDRMYMEMQVQAHESTLNMLNAAATATQTAEVRTLLQNAIPVVQQHLDRARTILAAL